MSFKSFARHTFNETAFRFLTGDTAETHEDVLWVIKTLHLNEHPVRFSRFSNGVASFSNGEVGGGNLTLDITLGTTNAEEAADLTFCAMFRLTEQTLDNCSSVVLWEPGHSQNKPIINFVNRSF